jgi:hypothetical protein
MSRLQDRRYWLGGGVLAAVAIAAIGWLGVISPQLSSASSLRNDANTVDLQNSVLQGKASALKKENDKLPALTTSLNRAVIALPFDSGLPEFTRQVNGQAAQNHVALTGITVASVTAVGNGNANGTGTGTGATPATGTTGTGSAPTSGAGGVFAIPITLVATGRPTDQLDFLKAIQVDGPRRALVSSTQFAPIADNTSIEPVSTMTVQLSIFTAPLTPQQTSALVKLLHGDVSSK